MKEIEKKYTVKKLPDIEKYIQKRIIQNYLYQDDFTVIRKRKIQINQKTEYKYTIKTKIGVEGTYTSNELEIDITEEEFENLKIPVNSNVIDKTRVMIPIENGLTVELDLFHGIWEGMKVAEIEFPNEEMAHQFIPPVWLGKELEKSKFANGKMAFMQEKEIEELKLILNKKEG